MCAWSLRRAERYRRYGCVGCDSHDGVDGGTVGMPPGGVVGSCWSRYFVRVLEMKESVRIIRQAMRDLPDGDIKAKLPRNFKLPAEEIYMEVENPRGQLGFYVVGDGSAIPARVKARGPSFCNLSITTRVCGNCMLADIPAIIGSIDIVMGECDR